jgi:stearoyl-CoA desaturase (delta-9 desaturase)
VSWFDNAAGGQDRAAGVHWARVFPFVAMHVACGAVLVVGWSPFAVAACIFLYLLRAFFVTGFYHRYFSHKSFRTSRAAQFAFAVLGNTAAQRGPLWWAAHHRHHHRVSDRPGDPHSPHETGVFWSHVGWLLSAENYPTDLRLVPDLAKYPELRWLDRFDTVVPALFAASLFAVGEILERVAPGLGTNGPQLLVWGFVVSTVLLFHVTCLVNSAAHLMGKRRFATKDQSRNSWIIAILTLGEGWHNNHHHYPNSTRQGFYWWEVDVTYYGLRALGWLGILWDIHPVPQHALTRGRVERPGA